MTKNKLKIRAVAQRTYNITVAAYSKATLTNSFGNDFVVLIYAKSYTYNEDVLSISVAKSKCTRINQ